MAFATSFGFVQHFDGLQQVALEGAECGADGWRAEAMGEQAEVGQAALDPGLQARRGPTRTQRRPVLGHEVNKLFADLPEDKKKMKVSAQSREGFTKPLALYSDQPPRFQVLHQNIWWCAVMFDTKMLEEDALGAVCCGWEPHGADLFV